MGPIERTRALARTRPLAAALEVTVVASCLVLLVGTTGALVSGPPTGAGRAWLGIVLLGVGVALFGSVLVPLYESVT